MGETLKIIWIYTCAGIWSYFPDRGFVLHLCRLGYWEGLHLSMRHMVLTRILKNYGMASYEQRDNPIFGRRKRPDAYWNYIWFLKDFVLNNVIDLLVNRLLFILIFNLNFLNLRLFDWMVYFCICNSIYIKSFNNLNYLIHSLRRISMKPYWNKVFTRMVCWKSWYMC